MVDTETATRRTARRVLIAGIVVLVGGYVLNIAADWIASALYDPRQTLVSPLTTLRSVQSIAPVLYALGSALIGAGVVIHALRPKVTRFHGSHTE